jgi:hypothetical protein
MATNSPHKESIVEVVTLYSRAQIALFHFAAFLWNKIWDENQGVS